MKSIARSIAMAASLLAAAAAVNAQVAVKDAWVRATVPNQKATGAFMTLQADKDSKLVSASSPITPNVEVHEMAMQDNVMKMREVPAIELPAGKPVELKPGGYHVMLMNLKQQVKEGETVPLTLVIEDKGGQRQSVQVQATVRGLASDSSKSGADAHGSHKH